MSNTYRFRLAFIQVPDGVLDYGHGQNARKARAEHKRIDRRIKRREHKRIIAEGMKQLEDERDWLNLMDDIIEDDYEEQEWLRDYEYEHWDEPDIQEDWSFYDDYYDPHDYDDHPPLMSDDEFREIYVSPRQHIVTYEDAGKSLGELLDECRRRT